MNRRHRLVSLGLGLGLLIATAGGCEDIEATPEDLAAAPESSSASTAEEGPSSTRVTEGQSAFGKAYKRAERLEDQIDDHQAELMRTADGIFDDKAARRQEQESPPGE